MKPPGFCFGRLMKIPKSNEPKIQELLGETQEELYFVASLYKSYCLDLRSVHIWDNLIITQLVVLTFLHIESSCFQDVLSLPSTLAFDYTSSDELLSHFLLFLPFQRRKPFFFFFSNSFMTSVLVILAYFISFGTLQQICGKDFIIFNFFKTWKEHRNLGGGVWI